MKGKGDRGAEEKSRERSKRNKKNNLSAFKAVVNSRCLK